MILFSLPRKVLRLQYIVARLPLGMIERQMAQRWDDEAPVRLAYERMLGVVDGAAGALLGDRELMDRGHREMQQADMLARAAALDTKAKRTRAEAAEHLSQSLDEAHRHKEAVREATNAAVMDAEDTEIEEKVRAGDRASEQLSRRKDWADRIADARIQAAEAEREAIPPEIDREEHEATEPIASELRNADEKTEEKEDADRLGTRAAVEREQR